MPCVVEQRHFQSIMLERMERLQIKMREGFERILRGGQASANSTRDDERLENNRASDSDGRMLRVSIQPILPSQPVASCFSEKAGTQKKKKRAVRQETLLLAEIPPENGCPRIDLNGRDHNFSHARQFWRLYKDVLEPLEIQYGVEWRGDRHYQQQLPDGSVVLKKANSRSVWWSERRYIWETIELWQEVANLSEEAAILKAESVFDSLRIKPDRRPPYKKLMKAFREEQATLGRRPSTGGGRPRKKARTDAETTAEDPPINQRVPQPRRRPQRQDTDATTANAFAHAFSDVQGDDVEVLERRHLVRQGKSTEEVDKIFADRQHRQRESEMRLEQIDAD